MLPFRCFRFDPPPENMRHGQANRSLISTNDLITEEERIKTGLHVLMTE
jgi:hypothetical protein